MPDLQFQGQADGGRAASGEIAIDGGELFPFDASVPGSHIAVHEGEGWTEAALGLRAAQLLAHQLIVHRVRVEGHARHQGHGHDQAQGNRQGQDAVVPQPFHGQP